MPGFPRSVGLRPVASASPGPLFCRTGPSRCTHRRLASPNPARPRRRTPAVAPPRPAPTPRSPPTPRSGRGRWTWGRNGRGSYLPLAAGAGQPDQAVADGTVVATGPAGFLARLSTRRTASSSAQSASSTSQIVGASFGVGGRRRGRVRGVHPPTRPPPPTFRIASKAETSDAYSHRPPESPTPFSEFVARCARGTPI